MHSFAAPAILLLTVLMSTATTPATAQYEDSRCKCICPTDSSTGNGTASRRRIWITTVPFGECTCERVVDPLPPKAAEFCLRCQCKSETRSMTIQKVVVVLVLCIISSLCLYMLFLSILHPLLVKARLYQPHVKLEEQQPDQASLHSAAAAASPAAASRPVSSVSSTGSQSSTQHVSSVVNRAVNRQERWSRAVEVQRDRVYAQHSMLN